MNMLRERGAHMEEPAHVMDIFLQPGDFYFGDRNVRINTLLGSCIAITLWHRLRLIGGMCHYVLPTRRAALQAPLLDGRYGDEALEMFRRKIREAGTFPAEYQVKVFGGATMLDTGGQPPCPNKDCLDPLAATCRDVSCRNQRSALVLAERHGFDIAMHNLGGSEPQNLCFELWNGYVWLKRPPGTP